MLFRELRFFLSRSLQISAEDREELERLIRQNGGVVAQSPVGATQLVDCDKLDARRPEWVSADFIKESVAFRTLQDRAKYSGAVFMAQQENTEPRKRVRMRYTNEEDARLLHFAKQRDWKATESLALSVWQIAESDRVTAHTAHSMHERFRKHLQMTTPREQRTIMSNAAATIRARWMEKEAEVEEIDDEEEKKEGEEQVVELTPRARASPNSTGFQDVVTLVRTSNSGSCQGSATSEPATIESRLREVGDKKLSDRTRSRKPKSPLRLSQRLQPSEGAQSNSNSNKNSGSDVVSLVATAGAQGSTPATPAAPATPATPEVPGIQAAQSTRAAVDGSASSPSSRNQNVGRSQQKRKRGTPRSDTTSSQKSSPLHQVEGSEADSVESTTSSGNGIFFCSAWAQQITDPTKRRMLQRFFDPPSKPAPQSQANSAESRANSDPSGAGGTQARSHLDERMNELQQVQVEQATDQETDEIICQLQMDTHQSMPSVVHALYHCSGDVEMARAFLRGASPPDMWSPEDDLLLAHLLVEESTRLAAVDAAVIHGDFSSMQVVRDADTILKRVQYLR